MCAQPWLAEAAAASVVIRSWLTMAAMLNGSKLDGTSCGLRDRQTLLYRGKYHFCAWLENPTLGKVGATDLEVILIGRVVPDV